MAGVEPDVRSGTPRPGSPPHGGPTRRARCPRRPRSAGTTRGAALIPSKAFRLRRGIRCCALLTHPVVAAGLDVGGLWVVYRTGLYPAAHGPLVQAHVLLAGVLFTASVVGRDPAPHRTALEVRVSADGSAHPAYAGPTGYRPAGRSCPGGPAVRPAATAECRVVAHHVRRQGAHVEVAKVDLPESPA
ncbi:cytochrome c oxidase assembly protein [Pseudonocardia sp. T1-2H]|uniref:cytochrome c oxidase assembly protein n=1 Tax=Pseudonocardia sp. T1-2H TaxID=3128899 RepID=UPI00310197E7